MNNMNTNQAPAFPAENITGADASQQLYYANSLGLFHPSAEIERGSAVKLECRPARRLHGGVFFLTIMPQKDAPGTNPDGSRKRASFSWDQRICVKLDFSDVAALLCVLYGMTECAGRDGKGLYHDSKDATTTIYFRGPSNDYSGYQLVLSRKLKNGGELTRLCFVFSAQEALTLRLLLEHGLFPIVFGLPGPGRGPSGNHIENEVPAVMPDETEAAMPF